MKNFKIGMIGLGAMGSKMALNIQRNGIDLIAYDQEHKKHLQEISQIATLREMIELLPDPKYVFLMLPSGATTSQMIQNLSILLPVDAVVIDASGSNYQDTQMRSALLRHHGIKHLDVALLGSKESLAQNPGLMVGGDLTAFKELRPFFERISSQDALLYTGLSGSAHFLKMIHNSIAQTMMQSIVEGMSLMDQSDFSFNLEQVTSLWKKHSTLSGELMHQTHQLYKNPEKMKEDDSLGSRRETEKALFMTALDSEISIPLLSLSLMLAYHQKEQQDFLKILESQSIHHDELSESEKEAR